jgi:ADP-heptose:LPS heptosyltransferase
MAQTLPLSSLSATSARLPPQRIAILRALYLGDLLCATPAFRALRERFPAAELTLIGLPWAAEFVDRSPHLDRFLAFPGYPGLEDEPPPGASDAFFAAIRETPYDLAIQMHGDGSASNGFVAALEAQHTLGYRHTAEDIRLDESLPYPQQEHETRRWLHLAAALGARTDDLRPIFPITAAEMATATALLAGHPAHDGARLRALIGLHVGAKDHTRRWPTERFAALGNLLWAQHGAALVLTGGAAERPLAEEVRRALHAPALDLVGKTDLGQFAATIAQLDLLVTNDTGASHLAAATSTPSVILFGPTRPEQWAPLNRRCHRALDACALVPGSADGADALRQLPVGSVLAACVELLRLRRSDPVGHATEQMVPGTARASRGEAED